ncbi:MAG: hypothetical protein HYV35_03670 [Lentisphaerae bacterium]|nr:hypothetical protein [Lentisphaerota bacterium]
MLIRPVGNVTEENKTIFRAHPPKPPFWHYPAIALFAAMVPGAFYVAALVIAAELITGFQATQSTRYVLAGVGCLLGIVTMIVFLRWEQNRWYWELTLAGFCGGRWKKKVYPLSSIVSLVDGMPQITLPAKSLIDMLNPRLSAVLAAGRAQAFLLVFQDGALLPLHLHACTGGTRLMEELKVRLGSRVCQKHELTAAQARALRLADWNRLVRP